MMMFGEAEAINKQYPYKDVYISLSQLIFSNITLLS